MSNSINNSRVTEFVLTGITKSHDLQIFLFLLFLFVYFFTIFGNAGIIFLVFHNDNLHTPMYFFISSLSFLDLCYSSDITPKMLVDFLSEKKVISYIGCFLQLFFFVAFGCTESLLFAVMSYDRHVAISNPLSYSMVMQSKTCIALVSGAYTAGFLHGLLETCCTFRLSFCASNILHHFVCDFPQLMTISCTDTAINELILFIFASSVTMSSVLVIVISYFSIFMVIAKIKNSSGRKKAFSTCSSHISAVTIFYSTVFYVYLTPKSISSAQSGLIATVFYTTVIPMLNPIIYSFRNKDIKDYRVGKPPV
uniref:G-protein coupled receptors family 1 profile domain-containing protein n=1 Tax=Leptobrachium leishanense TaxID=445787 RepID=A0A8C5LXU1_9ANUR